ncbi:MAG: hypothetical protein V4592_26000 [Bacteroidota bacterium]
MAACNLTIDFAEPAGAMIQKLQTKVAAQGGTFSGDETAGSIDVPVLGSRISGSYTISGQQMALVIDHKPFLISCNQIQSYLMGNL